MARLILTPFLPFKRQDNLVFIFLSKRDVRDCAESVTGSFGDDEEMPGELRDGEKTDAKFANELTPALAAVDVGGRCHSKFFALLAPLWAAADVLDQISKQLGAETSPVVTHCDLAKSRRVSQNHYFSGIRVVCVGNQFAQGGRWLAVDTFSDPSKNQLVWRRLVDGKYVEMPPDADGLMRSQIFPGLWLDPGALWNGDLAGISKSVERGVATREHAAFVKRLERHHQ